MLAISSIAIKIVILSFIPEISWEMDKVLQRNAWTIEKVTIGVPFDPINNQEIEKPKFNF